MKFRRMKWMSLLAVLAIVMMLGIAAAQTPTGDTAKFTNLGSYSQIYSRYYGGNVLSGILEMEIQPSGPTVDSYCIDLYKPISFGNIIVVNGDLDESTHLEDVDWCAVNYILANYDYTETYATGPLAGLNNGQKAAAVQAAIWYFVTKPYGEYTGASGVKYQFITDPYSVTGSDAQALRENAMGIINSVPGYDSTCTLGGSCTAEVDGSGTCNTDFLYPASLELTPETVSEGCEDTELTATVYDQNGDTMDGVTVAFTTDHGILTPGTGTTDSDGNATTTLSDIGLNTATVQAYAQGEYGSLLFDPANTRQSLTTLTLLSNSVGDSSTVICTPEPAIDVEKYVSADETNWYDADTEPGLLVPGGDDVYFKFVVTNTGNVDLDGITLSDSVYDTSGCTLTDPLVPGASFECTIDPDTAEPGENGPNMDTATATGFYDGTTVSDSDDAYYTPTYTKSGTVYYDDDGDGVKDTGELGIPYVTVFLCLGCPEDEAIPCNTIAITTTDADGYYEFTDVPACSIEGDECYVVSVPAETDDTTDFNENLHSFFKVVETDDVEYNEELERACIRFNLLEDETENDFGYEQKDELKGEGVKVFTNAVNLTDDYDVEFNIIHSNVYGLYSGPNVWWEVTYYFANTEAYLGDMYDGETYYFTLWDKWGGNLLALASPPAEFDPVTNNVTLEDGTEFEINYDGYAEYIGEDGVELADSRGGTGKITLHTGDQQEKTNPGKGKKPPKDGASYDADIAWSIGVVEPGEHVYLTIYVAPGKNPGGILQFSSPGELYINTGPVYRAYEVKNNDVMGKFQWALDNKIRLSVNVEEYIPT